MTKELLEVIIRKEEKGFTATIGDISVYANTEEIAQERAVRFLIDGYGQFMPDEWSY